eukprot:SAG31_NODE_15387_length_757_cov_2.001520_2_plen_62_part_01
MLDIRDTEPGTAMCKCTQNCTHKIEFLQYFAHGETGGGPAEGTKVAGGRAYFLKVNAYCSCH